jgi:hypothetical protein
MIHTGLPTQPFPLCRKTDPSHHPINPTMALHGRCQIKYILFLYLVTVQVARFCRYNSSIKTPAGTANRILFPQRNLGIYLSMLFLCPHNTPVKATRCYRKTLRGQKKKLHVPFPLHAIIYPILRYPHAQSP